jgi:Flp pilus assembly protein TadD
MSPMRRRADQIVVATCLLFCLTGCQSSSKVGDLSQPSSETTDSTASSADPSTTGSVRGPAANPAPDALHTNRLGNEQNGDLSLGNRHFRAGNFRLAERHFRRAVEQRPRDLEAWIGLAASYDRLRRWDLADRAYDQAGKIAGPSAEILNNLGYSYMLRGDYRKAREVLLRAQGIDPDNAYVKNNLELLEARVRKGNTLQ